MKIILKQSDLKTLKEENGVWSYSIKTKTGTVRSEGFLGVEEALKNCENNLKIIIRSILKK